MGLSVGIAGLPNVGKSTLLNALTQAGAEASNYPFCTIEQNVGIATLPDPDLSKLEQILAPREAVPTHVRFVDIAGLVEGAHRGEGLGNKFLAHVREVDAILHVVRCFEHDDIAHSTGTPDPVRDAEIVECEFMLADLDAAERALDRWTTSAKRGKGAAAEEIAAFTRAAEELRAGRPLTASEWTVNERSILEEVRFLSAKPCLYLANTDESDPGGEGEMARALIEAKGRERVIPVSIQIEEEISELPEAEQAEFLEGLGLEHTALDLVIRACYELLDLITFYTIANEKLRAWPLRRGSTALEAAGKIHSDMERGFIRAEVMATEDLGRLGSRKELHDHGLIHTVGRDYVVQDRDVVQVLFKV